MNQAHTPLEIVEEILQNLSIKSVIRYKGVCKAWSSLISDREFKKRHRSKHSSRRIFISSPSGSRSLDCKKGSIRQLRCPRPANIVESSNGLVCLALDKCRDFVIWNPTTDDYSWRLPNPELLPLHVDGSFIYGFGYDSFSDDYKIVVIADCKVSEDVPRIAIEVFSLRKNSWKTIPDLEDGLAPDFVNSYHGAVTFKGALHWQMSSDRLLGFDLQKEEAIALLSPPANLHTSTRIGVIDGCLCLSIPKPSCVEFWVMKEYRDSNSWQNMFCISSVFPRKWWENSKNPHELLPLCKTGRREMLSLRDGMELIKVRKDGTIQKLQVDIEHGGDGLGKSEAVVYEESLESPLDYI